MNLVRPSLDQHRFAMKQSLSKNELSLVFPEFNSSALLQKISEHSSIKTYPAGSQLAIESDQKDYLSLSICLSGIIKIQRKLPNKKYLFLYNISNGEWCNASFINTLSKKHNLIATTDTQVSILYIPNEIAESLILDYPEWRNYFFQSISKMYENLLEVLDKQSGGTLEDKIKHYLEYQKNSLKTAYLNISHQSLANELNVARESVSRKLKQLEANGYLRLSRTKIILQ